LTCKKRSHLRFEESQIHRKAVQDGEVRQRGSPPKKARGKIPTNHLDALNARSKRKSKKKLGEVCQKPHGQLAKGNVWKKCFDGKPRGSVPRTKIQTEKSTPERKFLQKKSPGKSKADRQIALSLSFHEKIERGGKGNRKRKEVGWGCARTTSFEK